MPATTGTNTCAYHFCSPHFAPVSILITPLCSPIQLPLFSSSHLPLLTPPFHSAIGQRHAFLCRYKVGFMADGRVVALDADLYNNAGNSLDLSHSVMDRALLHSDGVYKIPHVRVRGHLCRTNQVGWMRVRDVRDVCVRACTPGREGYVYVMLVCMGLPAYLHACGIKVHMKGADRCPGAMSVDLCMHMRVKKVHANPGAGAWQMLWV